MALDSKSGFLKYDDELGLAIGWAIICEDNSIDGADKRYFDLHGDHIPEEAMLKATTEFMVDSRAGKVMHDGEQVGDVVFAWPVTKAICEAFGDPEPERTGLRIGWKPHSEHVLKLFKEGKLRAFSIGGQYLETEELADD